MSEFLNAPLTHEPGDPFDDSGRGRDRRLLLLGGLVGALVLAGGGFLLLGSGDDSTSADASAVVPRVAATATPSPSTTPVQVVPAPASMPQGHNPFKPLVLAAAAGGDPTSAGGSPVASPAPTSTATAGGTPTGTGTPTASGGPIATTTYKLTLNAFGSLIGNARSMAWTVDGVRQSILVGQRFGKSGELVVLTVKYVNGASQAVLQIGDAAPRSIGVGATIDVM